MARIKELQQKFCHSGRRVAGVVFKLEQPMAYVSVDREQALDFLPHASIHASICGHTPIFMEMFTCMPSTEMRPHTGTQA